MRKSVNDPFAQATRRKELGLPKRRDMLDAAREAGERIDRQRQYIKDTITILENRDDIQNVDDLRALMNEACERLNYYSNGNVK